MATVEKIRVGTITPEQFRVGTGQVSVIYLGDIKVWEQ
tara:strand:+ start:580 stop:693 length:114 start_codon:yes stop_codon:yes gene_type:complete